MPWVWHEGGEERVEVDGQGGRAWTLHLWERDPGALALSYPLYGQIFPHGTANAMAQMEYAWLAFGLAGHFVQLGLLTAFGGLQPLRLIDMVCALIARLGLI
jgi:hypothetical protein